MTKFKIASVAFFMGIASLISCNKSEVSLFSDEDGINFYSTNTDNPKLDEGFEYDVKFNYVLTEEVELEIPLFIQGRRSEIDRKVSFKITDSTTLASEIRVDPIVIKAGESDGVVKIKMKRPSNTSDEFISFISIDPDNSDFKAGTMERQRVTIKVTDIDSYNAFNMSKNTWSYTNLEYLIGSFSFGKVRFICMIYKLDDFDDWAWDNYKNKDVIRELKAKFENYKTTPGSKPFYDETKLPEKVWIDFSSDFDNE